GNPERVAQAIELVPESLRVAVRRSAEGKLALTQLRPDAPVRRVERDANPEEEQEASRVHDRRRRIARDLQAGRVEGCQPIETEREAIVAVVAIEVRPLRSEERRVGKGGGAGGGG